jgi:hypothetical protein
VNAAEIITKLSGRKLSAARAFLDSPAAAAALAEKEAAERIERQRTRDELARATGPHKQPIEAARTRYAAALERRKAAQAELLASLAEERDAMQLAYAAEYEAQRAVRRIEDELTETADARIARFEFLMQLADDHARAALSFFPEKTNGTVVNSSNLAEINVARAAIAAAKSECEAMLTAPMVYDEVTARLVGLCERLEAPLADVQLNPPQIDKDGELAAPLRWGVKPGTWRVDEVIQQPRQSERLPKAGEKELLKKRGGNV